MFTSRSPGPRRLVYCGVFGCRNNNRVKPMLGFYGIPKDKERNEIWLKCIGRDKMMLEASTNCHNVCAIHFGPDALLHETLPLDVVPTLFLPGDPEPDKDGSEPPQKKDAGTQVDVPTEIEQTSPKQIITYAVETQTDKDVDERDKNDIPPAIPVANVGTQTGFLFYLEEAIEGNVKYIKPVQDVSILMQKRPPCSCGRTTQPKEKPKTYNMSVQTTITLSMNDASQKIILKDQITRILKRQKKLDVKFHLLMDRYAETKLELDKSGKRKSNGKVNSVKNKRAKPKHSIEKLRETNKPVIQAEIELLGNYKQIIPTNNTNHSSDSFNKSKGTGDTIIIIDEEPSTSNGTDKHTASESNDAIVNSFEDSNFIDKFLEWQKEQMEKMEKMELQKSQFK